MSDQSRICLLMESKKTFHRILKQKEEQTALKPCESPESLLFQLTVHRLFSYYRCLALELNIVFWILILFI